MLHVHLICILHDFCHFADTSTGFPLPKTRFVFLIRGILLKLSPRHIGEATPRSCKCGNLNERNEMFSRKNRRLPFLLEWGIFLSSIGLTELWLLFSVVFCRFLLLLLLLVVVVVVVLLLLLWVFFSKETGLYRIPNVFVWHGYVQPKISLDPFGIPIEIEFVFQILLFTIAGLHKTLLSVEDWHVQRWGWLVLDRTLLLILLDEETRRAFRGPSLDDCNILPKPGMSSNVFWVKGWTSHYIYTSQKPLCWPTKSTRKQNPPEDSQKSLEKHDSTWEKSIEIRHVLVPFMKTQDLNITGFGSTRMPTSQKNNSKKPWYPLAHHSLYLQVCSLVLCGLKNVLVNKHAL